MKKKISLENIFVMALGSEERLKWLLQHNINLVKYLDARFIRQMTLADITLAMIPREKIQELVKDITKDRILKLLEKERPDLYKLFTEPKNILWLDIQIGNFKKRFLK